MQSKWVLIGVVGACVALMAAAFEPSSRGRTAGAEIEGDAWGIVSITIAYNERTARIPVHFATLQFQDGRYIAIFQWHPDQPHGITTGTYEVDADGSLRVTLKNHNGKPIPPRLTVMEYTVDGPGRATITTILDDSEWAITILTIVVRRLTPVTVFNASTVR